MNSPFAASRHGIANALRGIRHVFVRDLDIEAVLGIYEHEKVSAQRIRVNVDLSVAEEGAGVDDRIDSVVCYEQVVNKIKAIVAGGHVNLVETLAEHIAARCLEDQRVLAVRVRVEKPDAIAEAAAVGVEIERTQPLL